MKFLLFLIVNFAIAYGIRSLTGSKTAAFIYFLVVVGAVLGIVFYQLREG
jgi:hypothetical protein